MGEPIKPKEAKERIMKTLTEGRVVYSRPHGIQRLNERKLSMVDCVNVLRGGIVNEAHREGSSWRYKVSTQNIEVIIKFLPYNRLMIITAWRK